MYYKIAFILLSIIITLITLFSYQNNSLAQYEDTSTNTFPELSKDYSCQRVKGGCDESPADIGQFIDLAQESTITQKNPIEISTKISINAPSHILSNIEYVEYYLHPTFTPDIVKSFSKDNNFLLNLTSYGTFDLKAKVFLKDGTVKDLELPSEEWEILS